MEDQMMRRSHQFFSQLVVAGVIAAGAASASPAFPAPPAETDAVIERTDWVQRCCWVDSPWGPRQQCRQVWVQPVYDNYDRGWGWGDGYDHRGEEWAQRGRRHWHDDD
jgi:hypothetical protein